MSTRPTPTSRQRILAQIEALEDAIASGLTYAAYDGQQVKYRDLDEMIATVNRLEAKLTALNKRAAARSPTAPFRLVTRS